MTDLKNTNEFEEVDLYAPEGLTWAEVQKIEEKATAVAVVVLGKDGSILVTARHNDFSNFGLPGGKIEPGETAKNAAIRECFEETGIRISGLKAVYAARATTHFCVTYFAHYCPELMGPSRLKAGHKECTPLWINAASLFLESCHYRRYNIALWTVLKKHGLIWA